MIADLEHTNSLNLLHFYVDFNDVGKRSFEKAIRYLTSRLCHKRGGCRTEVDLLYDSCSERQKQPSNKQLLALLQNQIQKAGEGWIVLDALDEHEERYWD